MIDFFNDRKLIFIEENVDNHFESLEDGEIKTITVAADILNTYNFEGRCDLKSTHIDGKFYLTLSNNSIIFDNLTGSDIIETLQGLGKETILSLFVTSSANHCVKENLSAHKKNQFPIDISRVHGAKIEPFIAFYLSRVKNNLYSLKESERSTFFKFVLNLIKENYLSKDSRSHSDSFISLLEIIDVNICKNTFCEWVIENIGLLSKDGAVLMSVLSCVQHGSLKHNTKHQLVLSILKETPPLIFNKVLLSYDFKKGMNNKEPLFNPLELLLDNARNNVNSINEIHEALVEAESRGIIIPPHMIIGAFMSRNEHWSYGWINKVKTTSDLSDELISYVREAFSKQSVSKADIENAMSAILSGAKTNGGHSSDTDIINKIELVLELTENKELKVTPELMRKALDRKSVKLWKYLSERVKKEDFSAEDLSYISTGYSVDASDGFIEDTLDFMAPFFDGISKKENQDHDKLASIKNFINVPKSLSRAVFLYAKRTLKEDLDVNDTLSKIKGIRQLTFFLEVSGLTPYEALQMDVSDRVNKLCLKIMI